LSEDTMNIEKIWDNSHSLQSATGLTKEEADELLEDFKQLRHSIKEANCGIGGRNESLDIKGIFMLFMIYYRHYIKLEMLALMFEVSSSTAKRLIDESEALIREILSKKNFSHLIAPNRKRPSRNPLDDREKSILTALSSLYADQRTV
jgi:hypothetical protein